MLCIRGTSRGPVSVCLFLSVCVCVTSQCSTKTAKRKITQTKPHDSPETLVSFLKPPKDLRETRPGSPPNGAPNAGGVGQNLMLETSNFVHGSAMWSLSLVMSECSLSGRGQGHVSNFYVVDLENFATSSRRYSGDIYNSVRSRFVYDTYKTMEATRSLHGWVHIFIRHRPIGSIHVGLMSRNFV